LFSHGNALHHAAEEHDLRPGLRRHGERRLDGVAVRVRVAREGLGEPRHLRVGVADRREHRDAAVLDLGLAQEADRRLVALLPEVLVAELERVEVAHDRVLLLGERLQVRVGEARLRRRGRLGRVGRARDGRGLGDGRDERAGAAEGEGGDDSLHDLFFFCARGCKLGSCV